MQDKVEERLCQFEASYPGGDLGPPWDPSETFPVRCWVGRSTFSIAGQERRKETMGKQWGVVGNGT